MNLCVYVPATAVHPCCAYASARAQCITILLLLLPLLLLLLLLLLQQLVACGLQPH
jgi:hypothetical protein